MSARSPVGWTPIVSPTNREEVNYFTKKMKNRKKEGGSEDF